MITLSHINSLENQQKSGLHSYCKQKEAAINKLNRKYSRIIKKHEAAKQAFTDYLASVLGDNFIVSYSTNFITVNRKGFAGEYPYQKVREVFTINIRENSMTFRNILGHPDVNKRIKFSRELTIPRILKAAAKYSNRP